MARNRLHQVTGNSPVRSRIFAVAVLAFAPAAWAQTTPLGTQFTYQGRLVLSGTPVNGSADFQFSLWDAAGSGSPPSGGNQIGAVSAANNLGVSDGLFVTAVDFGAPALNGDARWLQIAVRFPAGSGVFQALSPRQPLTSAPYATQTRGIFVDTNKQVAIGSTVPENSETWGRVLDIFDPNTTKLSVRAAAIDARFMAHVFGYGGAPPGSILGTKSTHPLSFITDGASRMTISSAGSVGVGTPPNLSYQLDVKATEFDSIRGNATNPTNPTIGVTGETHSIAAGSAGVWGVSNATTGGGRGVFGQSDSPDGYGGYFQGRGYFSGNLGIGTSSPVSTLHLRAPNNSDAVLTLESSGTGDSAIDFYDAGVPTWRVISDVNSNLRFNLNQNRLTLSPTGEVGIGTPTPQQRLDVNGRVHVAQGVIQKGAPEVTTTSDLGLYSLGPGWMRLVTDNAPIQFFTNKAQGIAASPAADTTAMTIAPNGSVGIGTSSPHGALHIKSAPNDFTLNLEGDNWAQLTFYPLGYANGARGSMYSDGNNLTIDSPGHIHLHTSNGGRTQVTELEILGGADIAEPFRTSDAEPIEPGMLVCIDPEHPSELRMSRSAYDATVAGIVSGAGDVKTGMVLRQQGTAADGTHPVALSGRVYCWVDADAGGPVRPGDLLTTSDTPGHAMKVADRTRALGATVGKALTSLERGTGMVLVLVTLQ